MNGWAAGEWRIHLPRIGDRHEAWFRQASSLAALTEERAVALCADHAARGGRGATLATVQKGRLRVWRMVRGERDELAVYARPLTA